MNTGAKFEWFSCNIRWTPNAACLDHYIRHRSSFSGTDHRGHLSHNNSLSYEQSKTKTTKNQGERNLGRAGRARGPRR